MLVDPILKEICQVVLDEDIEDAKFGALVIEAGIILDDSEWNMTNKLLTKRDEMVTLFRKIVSH